MEILGNNVQLMGSNVSLPFLGKLYDHYETPDRVLEAYGPWLYYLKIDKTVSKDIKGMYNVTVIIICFE